MKGKSQTDEEGIRVEAYLLSEKAGHPQGMEAYFWNEATLIVAGRGEKAAPAKRLAAKAKSKTGPAAKIVAAIKKKTPKKKA